MSCKASVQPLMTWFGAKVRGWWKQFVWKDIIHYVWGRCKEFKFATTITLNRRNKWNELRSFPDNSKINKRQSITSMSTPSKRILRPMHNTLPPLVCNWSQTANASTKKHNIETKLCEWVSESWINAYIRWVLNLSGVQGRTTAITNQPNSSVSRWFSKHHMHTHTHMNIHTSVPSIRVPA